MKILAFIPVRGGSKTIVLKNIKFFCGKPLVYWTMAALQSVARVDEIVVATDTDSIADVVNDFHIPKAKIYRRSTENAADTSITESVMLEYICQRNLQPDEIFMLVQATSPLTESTHFAEALNRYSEGKYDSMLTCVRNRRFFWNEDGTPENYDYRNRPRRQDFKGNLMENGAFYINTIGNIIRSGNRLSGRIGIYEMPEYTGFEIDEPDDWQIMEHLMHKYVLDKRPDRQPRRITLFLTDVDGVLTDGGMYYSESGDEMKKFNTHDGMAFELLRQAGIKTGFVTSENTKIVENRAKKLKADYLVQGKRNGGKLSSVVEICEKEGITLNEVAYIGDDVNCYDLLCAVGMKACPADACEKVKNIPDMRVLAKKGGDGVVREFAEMLLNERNQ
jgi:N-acylneuraminate cytidylyltransferase